MEAKVLLNSMARATFDSKTGEYAFKGQLITEAPMDTANVKTISDIAAAGGLASASDIPIGVGVDQGLSCPHFFYDKRLKEINRVNLCRPFT